MVTEEDVLARFSRIRSWTKGDQRAPHKPLLLLLALARLQRGEPRWISFADVEAQLRDLISDFGPARGTVHPEYPFWRLRSDGVWEVKEAQELESKQNASGDLPPTLLRSAHGGILQELYDSLRVQPALVNSLANQILLDALPASLHDQVLDAVGFPWVTAGRPLRDPAFRDEVLRIYERRCAVCGYDGRLGTIGLALEAAHIKWHAAGGPDTPDNGLALCSFHHVALDRGALTIDTDLQLQVSQHAVGQLQFDEYLLRYVGTPLRRPQAGAPLPRAEFLEWHWEWVFRRPKRLTS